MALCSYGDRTAGMHQYSDATAAGTVAAFMLMRGQHWFLSLTTENTMVPATARLMTSDFGRPRGNMTAVPGKPLVFQRVYEKTTIILDCNDFSGHF